LLGRARDFESAEVRGRTPFAEHATLQPFMAEEDGRGVARVVAVFDRKFSQYWSEPAGHLTMFEALPGAESAAIKLVAAACDWLRQFGYTFVWSGFTIGRSMPYTIDAYDQPPAFLHLYNPPYYHRFLKNAGCFTEKGLVQYQVTFTGALAASYRQMIAAAERKGIRLWSWDFDRIEEENRAFATLYRETFAEHWGDSQLSEQEFAGLTVSIKDWLVWDATVWAGIGGETVGGVYALPDFNQPKLGQPLDHGILLTIGVREKFRGRGVNLALGAKCFLGFIQNGYKTASYTLVLDDNWPSRRTAEKLGCRVTRNFVVYRRELR
jgi:GNAT superfamily N-acetyltransferase